MKCYKCEKEIDADSKFCPNCGTAVKEKPNHIQLEDTVKMASKVWYILGYIRGCDRNSKKQMDEFENGLKSFDEDLWKWHKEVVEYWQNWAKENNNEKDKKANGSERVRIPKAKGNKTE